MGTASKPRLGQVFRVLLGCCILIAGTAADTDCGPASAEPGDFNWDASGCGYEKVADAISSTECEEECIAFAAKLCAIHDDGDCYAYFQTSSGDCFPTDDSTVYEHWNTCSNVPAEGGSADAPSYDVFEPSEGASEGEAPSAAEFPLSSDSPTSTFSPSSPDFTNDGDERNEGNEGNQGGEGEGLSTGGIIGVIIAVVVVCLLVAVAVCIACRRGRRAAAARAAAAAGTGGKAGADYTLKQTATQAPGLAPPPPAEYIPPMTAPFKQLAAPHAQVQAQNDDLQLSMPPPLNHNSSMHSEHASSMHALTYNSQSTTTNPLTATGTSTTSSSHQNHHVAAGTVGSKHGNNEAPRYTMHGGPPVATPPPPPQPMAPLTGAVVAQQVTSGAGAVGQAAAQAPPECALFGVATKDSVTNYRTQAVPLVMPAAGASAQEWKEHLERQLDSVLGRLVRGTLRVLPGHHNRLQGGQAVVQIVEDTRTSLQYAIKFFLSTGAFKQEKNLYVDPGQPLGRFLPQLYAIAEGEEAALRDAHGSPLPPCIIMEKGEALDVWIDNSGDKIDLFTGLQVLSHIADRLKDLHAAGYVHRDIKPGNIMWLPRTKRWTLIDFGCAAATGSFARTGFSLYYAAPEALHSYMGGDAGVQAAEALDAWSLGVMAIELLTGKPALDPMRNKEETIEMILGDTPAPWEDPATCRAMLRPLGIFKVGVLRLLERDPSKRSTIHQFQQACRRSLANTTVTNT